jgi:hypothetical protein
LVNSKKLGEINIDVQWCSNGLFIREVGGDYRESDRIIAGRSICEYWFDVWVCRAGDGVLRGTPTFIDVDDEVKS